MHTCKLGNSGLELTAIGLGTWAIGGGGWKFGWGPQDQRQAIDAILRAMDLGINWIDTAAVYGDGRSEELVGKALRELPTASRPILATKCSRVFLPDGEIVGNLSRESIFREVEDSLRRLGVDVIDLYQVHWPLPDEDIEEGWAAMTDLIQQGKVRYIGVSNFDVGQMQRIQTIHPIASLQPPYSMIVKDIEQEALAFCQREGIGVVGYSPLYKGLLTGTFTTERAAALSDDDHRSRDPNFQPPRLGCHLALVDALRPIAESNGKSLGELAIAWVLRQPVVTSAIVGARRPAQIEEYAAVADWQLSTDEIDEIDRLLIEHTKSLTAAGKLSG